MNISGNISTSVSSHLISCHLISHHLHVLSSLAITVLPNCEFEMFPDTTIPIDRISTYTTIPELAGDRNSAFKRRV